VVTGEALAAAGWRLPAEVVAGLTEYERQFVALEFLPPRTLAYYQSRLDYLGFRGMGAVLDAGCGMGQWSVALASRNAAVCGIDIDRRRVGIAAALAREMGAASCAFECGPLEKLPYASGSFDAVFCYGVFMFTRMPDTLREFARVLKPGGRFYVNANSWGWYLHLLRDVPWNRVAAVKFILRKLLGRSANIVVTEPWLRRRLREAGLLASAVEAEGAARFADAPALPRPAPGYPSAYFGVRSMIEAIGHKTS
jgi:SAM-dependent methyltransferase